MFSTPTYVGGEPVSVWIDDNFVFNHIWGYRQDWEKRRRQWCRDQLLPRLDSWGLDRGHWTCDLFPDGGKKRSRSPDEDQTRRNCQPAFSVVGLFAFIDVVMTQQRLGRRTRKGRAPAVDVATTKARAMDLLEAVFRWPADLGNGVKPVHAWMHETGCLQRLLEDWCVDARHLVTAAGTEASLARRILPWFVVGFQRRGRGLGDKGVELVLLVGVLVGVGGGIAKLLWSRSAVGVGVALGFGFGQAAGAPCR